MEPAQVLTSLADITTAVRALHKTSAVQLSVVNRVGTPNPTYRVWSRDTDAQLVAQAEAAYRTYMTRFGAIGVTVAKF